MEGQRKFHFRWEPFDVARGKKFIGMGEEICHLAMALKTEESSEPV